MRKDGLYRSKRGGKTLIVNGHAKHFPPISNGMAFDSARGREDDDDIDDETSADEARDLEERIGKAVSDAIRKHISARDARRAKDAEIDHRQDFDPWDAHNTGPARERSADDEILGQVPARSTMTLRSRAADSKLGFDAAGRGRNPRDREVIDSRTAGSVSGRAARDSLLGELDGIMRGRA